MKSLFPIADKCYCAKAEVFRFMGTQARAGTIFLAQLAWGSEGKSSVLWGQTEARAYVFWTTGSGSGGRSSVL